MKQSHKYNILKKLYETGLELTARDFSFISNTNQYFVELEAQDLITSEWATRGEARVKIRYITAKQLKKAKKYLSSMRVSKKMVT